eukprot:319230-Pyramimonas_sp.AAC.1
MQQLTGPHWHKQCSNISAPGQQTDPRSPVVSSRAMHLTSGNEACTFGRGCAHVPAFCCARGGARRYPARQ